MLAWEIQTPVDRECVVKVILSLQSYHIRTNFILGASAFPHRLYKNIQGHNEHLTSALMKKMIRWRLQSTILLFDVLRRKSGEWLLFRALGFPYFF
jgi:hypothetical protein